VIIILNIALKPGLRPKWTLTHPNGNLMLVESIKGINLSKIDSITVIGIQEHQDKYNIIKMVQKQFKKLNLHNKLQTVIIKNTKSQPHTVYQGIKSLNLKGPILIKDSDNYFEYDPKPGNRVCFANLSNVTIKKAGNKSYVLLTEANSVVNIVEKRIISDTFCVGGYSFKDASQFIKCFDNIGNKDSLYISHVIYQMILDGISFSGDEVKNFLDWGTLDDWNTYRKQFCTLFIDLDGTLVNSSSEYFDPFWGETEAIKENVKIINQIYESGYGEIIITTTRSPESEKITKTQLKKIGLKYHRVLFGLLHGKRVIINDYAKSNPYRSCDAINIARDSKELQSMISGIIETKDNNL